MVSRSPYGERGLKLRQVEQSHHPFESLSLRRAWIEIGLAKAPPIPSLSLSLRRAWIEIVIVLHDAVTNASLSLRRAWIEIYRLETLIRETKGRSPYGERGLKFIGDMALQKDVVSLSLRRAWIEITSRSPSPDGTPVALLTESVD